MKVLLVDGVGSAVVVDRQQDCAQILVAGHVFVKRREAFNGIDVYRLEKSDLFQEDGRRVPPRIRHVGLFVAPTSEPAES